MFLLRRSYKTDKVSKLNVLLEFYYLQVVAMRMKF